MNTSGNDQTAPQTLTRLACYGTLCPGQPNHHELAGIEGTWQQGVVFGRLHPNGWGAALGYPAIVLDPDGDPVAVHVLESIDLPAHWPRLDAFEGEGYRRTVVDVITDNGCLTASIYELAA